MGGGVRIAGQRDLVPAMISVAFQEERGRAGAAHHRKQARGIYLKQFSRTGRTGREIFFQVPNPGLPGLPREVFSSR